MMSEKEFNRVGSRRGMSPNSQKNLGKGRLGNNHAVKAMSITRIQRGMLPLPCPYAFGKTWGEWLAERGLSLAGESAAYYRETLDRLEGKVTQPVEGTLTHDITFHVGKGYRDKDKGNEE